MLAHRVRVYFMDGQTVDGELRQQNEQGVWLYFAQEAAVHFYPQHRIKEMADLGPVYR